MALLPQLLQAACTAVLTVCPSTVPRKRQSAYKSPGAIVKLQRLTLEVSSRARDTSAQVMPMLLGCRPHLEEQNPS